MSLLIIKFSKKVKSTTEAASAGPDLKRKSVSFNDFGSTEKTTAKPTNAGILKMDSAPTVTPKAPVKVPTNSKKLVRLNITLGT